MRFLTLVLVNLRRHRLRALIGVAGIAFGVAAMLTIVAIASGAIGMFERILGNDSDYLVFEKNVSDLFFSSVPASDVEAIRRMPQVREAHPLLFGIVSSAGSPVITCFGLEADDPRLAQGEWLAGSAREFGARAGGIVLGARAAEFMKARMGEEVDIGPTRFRVAGIVKTENGFENGGVFLPLREAQGYFHRGEVASVVAVKLVNPAEGKAFAQAIDATGASLMALENGAFSQRYSSFRIMKMTAWAVGVCAFLLGGLGVANTMILSVFSRIREIAVLRVCGFSKGQVAALIFGEATAIAAAGLAVGLALGLLGISILPHIPALQGYVQARIQAPILGAIVGTALVTAIAGAIYPAQFAARIQPAEALRYE